MIVEGLQEARVAWHPAAHAALAFPEWGQGCVDQQPLAAAKVKPSRPSSSVCVGRICASQGSDQISRESEDSCGARVHATHSPDTGVKFVNVLPPPS